MKKLSFILILMALVQSTWAQTNGSASSDVVKTIEHPDFTAFFTFGVGISKVEFFNNSTCEEMYISVEGMTEDGKVLVNE